MRTHLALLTLLAIACDDGALDPTLDAAPSDGPALDGAAHDAMPADDGIADGPLIDHGTAHDMSDDMGVELDAAVDAMPDAMPDLGVPDAGDLDLAVPDAEPDAGPDATRDLYLPDFRGREVCANQQDDDDDGLADCADPDCRGSGACFHVREDCANGVDDDGDLHADCDDAYCLVDPACPAPDVAAFTTVELQARFDAECTGCHGPVNPFSDLDLSAPFEDAVVDVLSTQIGMPRVKPGDRQQSFLYLKLTWHHLEVGGDGEGMPPEGAKWSAEEAERLGRWIDALGTN